MPSLVLGFVFVGLLCLALLLQIIGVALPNWIEFTAAGVTGNNGLWKTCVVSTNFTGCEKIPESVVIASGQATRGMEVMAMLLMFGAIFFMILRIFVTKDSLTIVAAIVAIAAGVFTIIGVIIYGAKFESKRVNIPNVSVTIGAALLLCILSGIILIVDGAVSVAMSVKSIKYEEDD